MDMKQFSLTRIMINDWLARCKALVVDADDESRAVFGTMLGKQGITVLAAADAARALALFTSEMPDLVFVDANTAHADDYQVVRRIKRLSGERFVPVILLTSRADECALAECLESGGDDCLQAGTDDFLSKPVNPIHLRAKIAAFGRAVQLHTTAQAQYHQLLYEQELAKQVYAKTALADPSRLTAIHSLQRPASTFSGDILLVERSPSGALHVLVGDFTGHGLAAAIGALPAADVFRGMTAKGFTPTEIIAEINRKLRQTLPTGMFLAAVFVCLVQEGRWAGIYNSGLPDVLMVDRFGGGIWRRVSSTSIPLGVADTIEPIDLAWVEVGPNDKIVVATDGILEARNPEGEYFGEARLMDCLEQGGHDGVLRRLETALERFMAGAPQEDDLTLAVIPCGEHGLWPPGPETGDLQDGLDRGELFAEEALSSVADWHWELELQAPVLRRLDVVPLLVDTVVDLQGLREHRQALFTILLELFNNALDHGLLRLDSSLKNTSDGFARFFRERQERLAHLERGRIHIAFAAKWADGGGWLEIRITDDGAGFDFGQWKPTFDQPGVFGGRGIGLVRALCESLRYEGSGNVARVIYRW